MELKQRERVTKRIFLSLGLSCLPLLCPSLLISFYPLLFCIVFLTSHPLYHSLAHSNVNLEEKEQTRSTCVLKSTSKQRFSCQTFTNTMLHMLYIQTKIMASPLDRFQHAVVCRGRPVGGGEIGYEYRRVKGYQVKNVIKAGAAENGENVDTRDGVTRYRYRYEQRKQCCDGGLQRYSTMQLRCLHFLVDTGNTVCMVQSHPALLQLSHIACQHKLSTLRMQN